MLPLTILRMHPLIPLFCLHDYLSLLSPLLFSFLFFSSIHPSVFLSLCVSKMELSRDQEVNVLLTISSTHSLNVWHHSCPFVQHSPVSEQATGVVVLHALNDFPHCAEDSWSAANEWVSLSSSRPSQ